MKKIMGLKSVTMMLALLTLVSVLFSGCGTSNVTDDAQNTVTQQAGQTNSQPQETKAAGVSGSATAVGSSALQPLAEKAAEMFMGKNPDAKIQVQGGGSGTGLKQVAEGACEIGNSDVFAAEKLPEDQAAALVDNKVCVVGFATVTNPKVKVDDLSAQQLIDIFTGKITNWKDVGGDDLKIIVLNRPQSSGTRATFKKYALNGADEAQGLALTEESSGAIKKALTDNEGSISYLALSYVDSSVKSLKYEGVEPTADNVKAGKYPIWSYEHMYTKGEATGAAKAFIEYMMSDEFKPTIIEMGYIANSEMTVSRDK